MKNTILENIVVEKLVFSGKGLAHHSDGRAIMIAWWVIPGSIVNVRVLRSRSHHIEAQVLTTIKPSPIEIPLPSHFQVYGGAKWLSISYEEQLKIKEEQVHDAFRPLFRLFEKSTPPTFHPITASKEIYGYRNKVEFSFGKYISEKEGIHDEFRFGFHEQGMYDRIINCTYCALASDRVNEIFHTMDTLTRNSGLPTYDPKRSSGFFRHFVVREGKNTNEIMAILSLNTQDASYDEVWKKSLTTLLDTFQKQIPEITSFYLLHNTGKADIVTGEAELVFWNPTITEKLLGKTFHLGVKSFFQTNTWGAEDLYSIVRNAIKYPGGTLLDLYAGTGTIGILLADLYKKVYSVEIVKEASLDAEKNAILNGVDSFETVAEPVEKFLETFLKEKGQANTLIIDPPRDGMHPKAPKNLLAFQAKELIYVSCNPSTLARDLEHLLASGEYHLTDVYPVDMFPHTHHIETVVRLELISK